MQPQKNGEDGFYRQVESRAHKCRQKMYVLRIRMVKMKLFQIPSGMKRGGDKSYMRQFATGIG